MSLRPYLARVFVTALSLTLGVAASAPAAPAKPKKKGASKTPA